MIRYIGPGVALILQIAIAAGVGCLALAGWYWKRIAGFLRRRKDEPKKRD